MTPTKNEQTFDSLLVWQIDGTAGCDAAWITVEDDSLAARGFIAGQRPAAYTASYSLETSTGYATRRLAVTATNGAAARSLDLRRIDRSWFVDGLARPDLDEALDCDIEGCPLTNTMPILRHDLHRKHGEVTLTMAYVRLPSLEVVLSEQTYTCIRPLEGGEAIVRYASGDFESDLTIDADGFVKKYPKLGAHRVTAQ